ARKDHGDHQKDEDEDEEIFEHSAHEVVDYRRILAILGRKYSKKAGILYYDFLAFAILPCILAVVNYAGVSGVASSFVSPVSALSAFASGVAAASPASFAAAESSAAAFSLAFSFDDSFKALIESPSRWFFASIERILKS